MTFHRRRAIEHQEPHGCCTRRARSSYFLPCILRPNDNIDEVVLNCATGKLILSAIEATVLRTVLWIVDDDIIFMAGSIKTANAQQFQSNYYRAEPVAV